MVYARTAYNRIVYASPFTRLGPHKNAVGLAPFVRFCSATFFCARETATQFLLSGAKKRQIQPERYVQYVLKYFGILENFLKKTLTRS
jgi:hypothetical protein